ncbi:GntR family transcriptional regulator [Acerihabitans arboris]|uniref:UTRA domain-containing protein n=1 Tax=Acerihabitans arboris TaxID=2691583 RepID=A0A845SI35_9GAMM|nr:GntR family transcriptional regulator [Acerihabitans arboris]NDL62271.1 UTRA domain-containing protein [Acerihabitans arboris]
MSITTRNSLRQNAAVPLYKQLKEQILSDIGSGRLNEGEKIPTEVELSELYNISRVTVRNAVKELVDDNILIKKQGKGTFVCPAKIERKVEHLLSFSAACQAQRLTTRSRVVTHKILADYRDVRQWLALDDDDQILYIQRIRYAGDAPLMLENNYYSYHKFKFLIAEDLSGSLYQLLAEKYHIHPTHAGDTTLELVKVHGGHAALLQKPLGESLFLMKTLILDEHRHPLHYGEQYIIGERYLFKF